MKFAIVVFPGSNCDHDAYHAAKHVLGQDARFVWHKETSIAGADVVILPGGFSHGDYLRTGAIARFSPVMARVMEFAAGGGPVLGVCNGFQILIRSGVLLADDDLGEPATLAWNDSARYKDLWVQLAVTAGPSVFLRGV